MRETYLYPYSAEEACRRGEQSLWRASYLENIDCKDAIQKAVRQHYDGDHLDKKCLTEVIQEFGYNIIHIDRSSSWICFGDQPFHHCRSNLFDDTGAPRRWLNLHKSNAANERLADGLRHGRAGPWRYTSGQDSLILTALATMRKKTRLAAVPCTVNIL